MADALKDTLPALRAAIRDDTADDVRQKLIALYETLSRNEAALSALLEASEAAAAAQKQNRAGTTDHDTVMGAAAVRALKSAGIHNRLKVVGEDAALSAVGVDGSLDVPDTRASAAAVPGAVAALLAQAQLMPVGVLPTPGGMRGLSYLRSPQPAAQQTLESEPAEEYTYVAPEMTDEIAARVGAAAARYKIKGNISHPHGMSLRLAVRQALWDEGFCTPIAYPYETMRRRLYRQSNARQDDPALRAFEREIARLNS